MKRGQERMVPGIYPAKSMKQMEKLARTHWAEWRPKTVASLEKRNAFRTATTRAASKAYLEMISMMQSGQPAHEAEELVLKRYILLKPEPEVIAEMEAEFS